MFFVVRHGRQVPEPAVVDADEPHAVEALAHHGGELRITLGAVERPGAREIFPPFVFGAGAGGELGGEAEALGDGAAGYLLLPLHLLPDFFLFGIHGRAWLVLLTQ